MSKQGRTFWDFATERPVALFLTVWLVGMIVIDIVRVFE